MKKGFNAIASFVNALKGFTRTDRNTDIASFMNAMIDENNELFEQEYAMFENEYLYR